MRRVGLAVFAMFAMLPALVGCHGADDAAPPVPKVRVVGHTADGWQVVEFIDVRVELPPGWVVLPQKKCDLKLEHLGPPDLSPCAPDAGLWFFSEATFDPAVGPGVHRAPRSRHLPDGGWAGYVERADRSVDVADPERATVSRILGSVRSRPAG